MKAMMTNENLAKRLDRVYGARDLQDLEHAYDQWARDYDAEVSRLGFLLRSVATGYIGRFIPPEGRILDAGAGTGLIGSYLAAIGYRNLTAIDLSDGMLSRARERGCYRSAHRMILGEPLDFQTDEYDSAYAVGVFTEGHAPPAAFDEIARVVRPGGRFVFSIRDDVYREHGYQQAQSKLERDGRWRQIAASPVFQPYPEAKPDVRTRVFAYEML